MANDAVKSQLQALGIDEGIIRDIMTSVEPDPITGKIGVDSLMKYLLENKNPHLKRALQNGARLVDQQRREPSVDWPDVNLPALPVQENVTWWLKSTMHPDGKSSKEPARFMLECMTYGNKIDAPRLVDKYKSPPTPEELLHFIRRCITNPLPGLEPCLPNILIIQRNFQPHAALLKEFLDTLPSPCEWIFESEETSFNSMSIFSYEISLESAHKFKERGNERFRQHDREGAIAAYSDAIDCLMNAIRSDPSQVKNRDAEQLLAVCSANRAAALLLPGSKSERESDLHGAWKDGQVAIRVDPSYAKGYIRVATVHQRLGNLWKAQETIAGGLQRLDLQDHSGLVDSLIHLQTDGKGLPDNEEELMAWKELVLIEDEQSAMLMKGIGGLWHRRIKEHSEQLRAARLCSTSKG